MSVIKKHFPGGQASMSNIGPALAPKGVKPMEFITRFNADKNSVKFPGAPLKAEINLAADKKSFTLEVFGPTTTYFIQQETGIKKGSKVPGREIIGSITWSQIIKIAKIRLEEDPSTSLKGWCKSVESSAKSAGFKVEGSNEDLDALLTEESIMKRES